MQYRWYLVLFYVSDDGASESVNFNAICRHSRGSGNSKLKVDLTLLMNISEHRRFPASGQAKDKLAKASWRFMVCLFTSVNMSVFDELLSQSHLILFLYRRDNLGHTLKHF